VGPRAGLDDVEKRTFLTLPGLDLRPLGRPARGQSLYRLSYHWIYLAQNMGQRRALVNTVIEPSGCIKWWGILETVSFSRTRLRRDSYLGLLSVVQAT
jgi:hypothetical protein